MSYLDVKTHKFVSYPIFIEDKNKRVFLYQGYSIKDQTVNYIAGPADNRTTLSFKNPQEALKEYVHCIPRTEEEWDTLKAKSLELK